MLQYIILIFFIVSPFVIDLTISIFKKPKKQIVVKDEKNSFWVDGIMRVFEIIGGRYY